MKKTKPPESKFRPGQIIRWNWFSWKRGNYEVVRVVCGRYVLRRVDSGSIGKHNVSDVDSFYEIDSQASEENAVSKILIKYGGN